MKKPKPLRESFYRSLKKTFLIMRIATFLLILGILQAYAVDTYSQKTRLSLNFYEAELIKVLDNIEEESEFFFLYNEKLLDTDRKVTIAANDQLITNILDNLFAGTDVKYSIIDRKIILAPDYLTNGTDETISLQQQIITGRVTDSQTRESMPGVNIVVKGTSIGTITDINGNYSLTVTDRNAILVFSFIGYISQEIPLNGKTTLDISLEGEVKGLEEVVVVGYGTQRKATLTGSVVGVGADEIVKAPAGNIAASLQGALPGLISLQRTGDPGNNLSSILIRGQNTTGDNSPLVLVDGIPEPDWQRINNNDIESISILKDAAAAIYGVQAANGVILVTTKRGKIGKPVFDFTYNQGFVQPTRLPEMASSATLAEYSNEYLERTGAEPMYTEAEIQKFRDGSDPINYPNADWIGECLKKFAVENQANLNVRGGTENVRYSLSGSYFNQDDIIKNGLHNFKNYTVRSNIDTKVGKNITLSLDINAGLGNRMAPYDPQIGTIIVNPPTVPVFWPGGYPSNPPSDQGQHPMINNTGGSGYNNEIGKRWTGKVTLNINIPWIKGLGVDGYFNYIDESFQNKVWSTPWTYYAWDVEEEKPIPLQGGYDTKARLEERFSDSNSNLLNFRIKFERQFSDHYLNTFIAAEQSKGNYKYFSAYRRDFMATALDELFAGSNVDQITDGSSSESARQNLFGRLSYNFQEKYLLDFNFRYDGSYRFPKGSRWGFFPGISAAWRITKENFMKDNPIIDELKLRASYGEIGNDEIAPFQFLQGYNLKGVGYMFGSPSAPAPAIYGSVSPNTTVTWEVASIANIGLDGQLFDNLLGFTIDIFKQRRSNILTTRELAIPKYTGLVLPAENIGIVENKGMELSLSHRNTFSVGSGFTYLVSGNIAFSRSKVVDIAEAEDVPDYQKAEGHILGAGLFYQAIGIFRTQEEVNTNPIIPGTIVGDLQYRDINDDDKITALDRVRMDKSIIPEITYGFNLSAEYGDFSLFAHLSGVARAHWFLYEIARIVRNAPKELLENRYTPGSMDSKYPWIPTWEPDTEVSGMLSTFWLQNASFLRLKTLDLSYNLPSELLSKIAISRMRVFISGSNLFTITGIKRGYDPEGANNEQRYGGAHFYPQTKVYNLGVQITF